MPKILIVEDEASEGHLIAQILRGRGYDSLLASDGEQALELMKTDHFDAVVTDLAMPNVNGLRLIRTIRSGGDTIPIIAVSGKNADQLLLAEDYGANAILAKPVDPEKLLKLVASIVDENRGRWSAAWIHPEFGKVDDH